MDPTENGYVDVSRAQPHVADNVERRLHRLGKMASKPQLLAKKFSLPSNLDTFQAEATQAPSPTPSGTKHASPPPPPPPPPPPQHAPHALGDPHPLSLAVFAQRYSNHLPAEIVVTRGCSYAHISLNCEDTLEVHQIRELSIVHSTTNDGKQFKIPLNSPIEFCILYDPDNNIAKTIKGYNFERVSDLISVMPRPKLVCARSTWEGKAKAKDGSRAVIDDREVLVVGEVVLPAKKKRKRHLRMYSITRQMEKVVPEDCVGNFSTKPVLLPLYLPEITGYVKEPFPCKAVVQEEGLVVQPGLANLVCELSGRVLTLTAMTKETALVTTLAKGTDTDGICYPTIIEVPVDMPQVQVSVVSFTCEKEAESETSFVEASSSSTEAKEEGQYEIMSNARLWDMSGSLAAHSLRNKPRSPEPLPPPPPPRSSNIRPRSILVGCDRLSSPPPPPPSFIDARSTPSLPPPPLPMRPTLTDPQTSTPLARPSISHEPLRPMELIKQHGHALPIQVKIISGYHSAQCSLLRDEVYRVHLLTEVEGVSVADEKGSLFLVPVDSTVLFGVVFNPFNNFQSALQGYVFDTALDIVNSRQLPSVVGVTTSHRGQSADKSVEVGEVLIVSKVERVGQGEKTLVVYSLATMATKKLSGDCKGHFTTSPSSVKLTLALILKHIPCVVPTCAVAYGDLPLVTTPTGTPPSSEQEDEKDPPPLSPSSPPSLSPSSPSHLLPLPPIVTLLKTHPKGVLVATAVLSKKAIWNPYAPVEISLDLPVEVILAPKGVRRVTVRKSRPRSQVISQGLHIPRGPTNQGSVAGAPTPDTYPVQREDQNKLPALPPKYYQQLLRVPYQVSVYQRIMRSMADQALQGVKQQHLAGADQGVNLHQDDASESLQGVQSHQGDTEQSEDAEISRGDEEGSTGSSDLSYPDRQLQSRSPRHSEDMPSSPFTVLSGKPTVAMGTKSTSCEQLEGSINTGGGGGHQPSRGGALVKPRSLSDQSSSQVSSELANKSLSASSQLSCDQPQSELNEKVVELSRQISVLTTQLGNLQEKIDTMNWCLSVSSGWGQGGPHPLRGYNENQQFLSSLTSAQVLHLLDAVGLSMYREQFEREGVDGRLLCKCSDQVLQNDLKIASQLHRLKLLSFISGEVNVVCHLMPPLQNGTA